MSHIHRIVIIGGGIAGMTLAHGLARAGHAVRVIEAGQRTEQLGTGIMLLGNTLRALDQVGLAQDCIARGFAWDSITNRDATGRTLHQQNAGRVYRSDAPAAIGIMRPVLAKVLTEHAEANGAQLDFGTTVEDFESDADGVSYRLSTGETGRCDLLVGADGVYSKVRTRAFGSQYQPKFAGQGVWRYTVERPAGLEGMVFWHGEGHQTVGTLPLSEELCYFFSLENSAQHVRFPTERLGELLRERLAPFTAPEIAEVAARIDGTRHVSFRPLDILLMPQPWYRGRVALVGDAAHAMTPQMTSGGGMAIEDAVALAQELSQHACVPEALAAYCERRAPRVKRLYEISLEICVNEQAGGDGGRGMELLMEGHALLAQPF
ncbi:MULTISPECIES: FAD-dependent monooxygenase [unclassified Variovorax]|uniref:FAD-dependent monooxygenase n=1 Tax=unclassified Variovorax TaxID=663243 RepID=UPI0011196AD1|nr:FAD-dependent monooxygenase [Variovorax sp. KBS0712]TSD56913.1 FAD-dependent oxidoreductase [Variovorax sp. KBS0712]BER90322.1 monooxygenases [Variovorax sp.]